MQTHRKKRGLSLVLAILMVATLLPWAIPAALAEDPVFAICPSGGLQGMPLFNGNPDDLEAYLDTLWAYCGVEGFAVHATESRNNSVGYYTLVKGANAGKRIVSGHRAVDVNGGTSSAVPSSAGFAHSWNAALAEEVGRVAGNERLATINHAYSNLANLQLNVYGADADIRVNQNNGRFYNGFGGEDPMHSVALAAGWAGGMNGTLDEVYPDGTVNTDRFWLKHSFGTKHFPNYGGEYNRQSYIVNASARGSMEYHYMTGIGLAKTNTINGFMSSFGSMNGIPTVMTPIKKYVNSYAKWAQFSSPDYNAQAGITSNNTYNGYQPYGGSLLDGAPNNSAFASLISLTRNQGGGSAGQLDNALPGALWEAVYNANYGGLWGITPDDVRLSGRDQMINIIRLGVFNERTNYTTTGKQINWPYIEVSSGGSLASTMNRNNLDHQAVILRAAQEIPVLLKNNGVLPLAKDNKVYSLGYKTSHMNVPQYNVSPQTTITNSGLTPIVGLQRVGGTANVINNTTVLANGVITAIKNGDGTYWYSDGTTGNITARAKPETGFTDNFLFSVLTYGQGTVWVHPLARIGNSLTTTNANNAAVTGSGTVMSLTANTATSTLRVEEGANGKYHLMVGNMAQNSWTSYYSGRLLYNNNGNIQAYNATLGNIATAATQRALASTQFEFEIVDKGGYNLATDGDAAIVFLGNNTLGLSEGNDRGTIDMGFAQHTLASGVAAKYPGKTIVVVASNEPVLINELKEDPNIGAIILNYNGGGFSSYGLAQCIYGDVDFTGRTATTWYKSNDVFPYVDKYISSSSSTFTVANVDPRYAHSNLTQTDPESTRLTYWYADPADVAFAFGAGLSYATFEYSNMSAGAFKADGSFDVTVTVKNTSAIASQEVLQLYASNPDSAYGDAAPGQKLVAFDKVALAAGESKTVTLNVDPLYISIWDVSIDDYLIEDGEYDLYFGSDCYTSKLGIKFVVDEGNVVSTLRPETPINVFDRSFMARSVVYREFAKENSIKGFRSGAPAAAYYVVMSREAGSYTAIKNVQLNSDLDRVTSITASVAKIPAGATSIEVRLDAPDGPLYATIPVTQTSERSYNTTSDGIRLHATVREIGYVDRTVDVVKADGVHDLYFVFGGEDARLNTIQLNYAVVKTELADAIGDFEALNPYAWMGTDSWDDAVEAYEAALAVFDDDDATQAEVDQATADLLDAIDALVVPFVKLLPGQPSTAPLRVKQTYQITLDSNLNDLVFFSSNSANVTVSATGLLTGVKAGLAVITARSLSNPTVIVNIVVTCTI
ncbi:MAG: glycoside hydrolase family 3 C-terminal domain-containing protein [Oscillospiraceae bacterium]|nr:glycoside hydrolase family 3 C-terminal domain-containing protein [Oscillospiraceae bacterium]